MASPVGVFLTLATIIFGTGKFFTVIFFSILSKNKHISQFIDLNDKTFLNVLLKYFFVLLLMFHNICI